MRKKDEAGASERKKERHDSKSLLCCAGVRNQRNVLKAMPAFVEMVRLPNDTPEKEEPLFRHDQSERQLVVLGQLVLPENEVLLNDN